MLAMNFIRNTLSEINDFALKDPAGFIKSSCEDFVSRVDEIAKAVAENKEIKVIALAGPSASGKTTSAHILCDLIEKKGLKTAVVSLDDFYHNDENVPRNKDGSADYETVDSLNTDLIISFLSEIIEKGRAYAPLYDFKTHKRQDNANLVDIGENGIVLVEGLHALNPKITSGFDKKNLITVYASVNDCVEDENGVTLLSSRQIRLVRRALRDNKFRGIDINKTLKVWNAIVRSEEKYLFPCKNLANFELITFNPFEPCIYRESFCAMREFVDASDSYYVFFIKTVNMLEMFEIIDEKLIPDDALVREFIGGLKHN